MPPPLPQRDMRGCALSFIFFVSLFSALFFQLVCLLLLFANWASWRRWSSRSLHAFKHQLTLSLSFISLLFVFFASPRCLRVLFRWQFFCLHNKQNSSQSFNLLSLSLSLSFSLSLVFFHRLISSIQIVKFLSCTRKKGIWNSKFVCLFFHC